MSEQFLQTSIAYLKGVGPKRAEVLEKELNIKTYADLLYYFPFRYEDRTKFYRISEVRPNLPYVQLKGKITYIEEVGNLGKKRLIARLKDESGQIDLVWFKGIKFIKSTLRVGEQYVVFAKPTTFNQRVNLVHPEMESLLEYKN